MSNFLDNLKKSVDEGTFNSEAANKLKVIDDLAEELSETKSQEELEDSVEKKLLEGGIRTVDGDEVAKLNSEYEEKMKKRAREEILMATLVTLINSDEELDEKIYSLGKFVWNLKQEHKPEDEGCAELFIKIEELESKYDFPKYVTGY